MMQKTYTVDFITKKRVKNDGYVKRYYIENNHEPIVSRQEYYMVQEEMERRNNKRATGNRYNGTYLLSGLLICEECGHTYYRMIWCFRRGRDKITMWRCGEKLNTAKRKCKNAPSLCEENLYPQILNQMQKVIDIEIKTASSPLLQTKALIRKYIGNKMVQEAAITKVMLDSIIEKIVIRNKD